MTYEEYDKIFYNSFIDKVKYEYIRKLFLSGAILPIFKEDESRNISFFKFNGYKNDRFHIKTYVITHSSYGELINNMFSKNSKVTPHLIDNPLVIATSMNNSSIINHINKLYTNDV